MKVLFLDIDGVLNSRETWKKSHQVDPRSATSMIDPLAMWRLKQIQGATNCKIVITSSWRHIYPLEQIAGFLWRYGIDRSAVIGKTPRLGRRGHEIRAWLKDASKSHTISYAILDDDADAATGGVDRNKFIKTEWETGLMNSHVMSVVNILGKKVEIH